MTFSRRVLEHWHAGDCADLAPGEAALILDPTLREDRDVSLMRLTEGGAVLSLSPRRALQIGLDPVASGADQGTAPDSAATAGPSAIAEAPATAGATPLGRFPLADLLERITSAGLALNDPDQVFHLPLAAQRQLRDGDGPGTTRQLVDPADAEVFARLASAAPEDDWDEAYVELDHWLVQGTFDGDVLASVASAYPWAGGPLADIGVITLPGHRGRGLGRTTVRALSLALLDHDHEPQYRCRQENTASAALARSAGFEELGTWQVLLPARS